ncbi:hypothetical protein PROFUN_00382 [Planoprotostelium fungivorum]|uniref:GH16 domain-containing protein n=1 Tax=Planoprotostelium fungivorum TaxID=1890364 RepID=A0A2P6NY78_9EUKA|nr:hypothetical protein PROFUN_00382 [Planoprotostelium fungivorum]
MKPTLLLIFLLFLSIEGRRGFGRWKGLWTEEFHTSSLGEQWKLDTDCSDCVSVTSRGQLRLSSPIETVSDALNRTVRLTLKYPQDPSQYNQQGTAAPWKPPLRIEFRAKVPARSNMWVAVRLRPVESPAAPSLDIMTADGATPWLITGAIKHSDEVQSETVDLKTRNLPNDVTMGFYNHVLMWTGESITWSVSEIEYLRVEASEMMKRINTSETTEGYPLNWHDDAFYLDFIRLYQERD